MFRLVLVSAIIAFAYGKTSVLPHTPTLDGRIVGGVSTTIEEYPYQLSFGSGGSHSCGASLIRPDVAVTAAHCTANKIPSFITIRAGNTNRASGGQLVNVLRICDHPKFSPANSFDYDISVLQLDRSFNLSASIQTIPLQPRGLEIPDGTLATVTGFGRLWSGGASPSVLQKVVVPKVSHESCSASYPFPEKISDRMICFGLEKGGKDACQGDSGGPLVVDGHLAGVVSWGYGCALPNLPGVYAKVSNPEIHDHINTCIAQFK